MTVVGLDIGGTSVRCAVVSAQGALRGVTRGPGANFRSSGPGAVEGLRRVVADGLAAACTSTRDVLAVAAGVAGAAEAGHDDVKALLQEALDPLDLPPVEVREDLEIAFRSASDDPQGVLLLAGTGAVAARFEQWRRVARCDGMGWLLGDVGSGVWLGREVLRSAAADLDHRGPRTALTQAVLERLSLPLSGDQRQSLIRAVTPLPPARWGEFAPLALALDAQDPVATGLLDEAAVALAHAARSVDATKEIIYAGGLLTEGGLRHRLDERFSGSYASAPVMGACIVAGDAAGMKLDREELVREYRALRT